MFIKHTEAKLREKSKSKKNRNKQKLYVMFYLFIFNCHYPRLLVISVINMNVA